MTRSFLGAMDWKYSARREGNTYVNAELVSVRLSEAVTSPEYRVTSEVRTMGDGRAFYGVKVQDAAGAVVLSWNSIDPERWTLPESPHTATVLADLCDALRERIEAQASEYGRDAEQDAAQCDALAAGRLLLSSAAFQRAALAGSGSGSGAVVTAMHAGQPAEGGQP